MLEKEFLHTGCENILRHTKYLSQTIDDFRNFFKPDKEKASFYPQQEIERAYEILKASLDDKNIKFEMFTPENFKLY
jgi:two-component system C4-dicarboxylate transport sensor histidine kinase DctB